MLEGTERAFDVCIVGGGISGVALLRELGRRGFRVLLVEKGDLASGTSQASGMLAWGGLLYLRNLELRTVARLSAARDRWIAADGDEVAVAPMRYLPLRSGGRAAWWVRTALEAYWWLGRGRRPRPFRERGAPETRWPFVAPGRFGRALAYEEAALTTSDARLVLDWALAAEDGDRVVLDHTELVGASRGSGGWEVELVGEDGPRRARASVLVNAAGVWADRVSALVGVETAHRHVLSKGVYLVLRRPRGLDAFLAFESGDHGDVLTLTPWGPVALWGSTETIVEGPEESFAPTAEDVAYLARRANQNLAAPLAFDDVVALRSGVRPLAVPRGEVRAEYPLDLTRGHAIDVDAAKRAVTLFGGKFTSAAAFARKAADAVAGLTEGSAAPLRPTPAPAPPAHFRFADHPSALIDPARARDAERCRTLMDYLRRRTDIAQQMPRLGLGRADEHAAELRSIAAEVEGDAHADRALAELRAAADLQDDVVRRGLAGA